MPEQAQQLDGDPAPSRRWLWLAVGGAGLAATIGIVAAMGAGSIAVDPTTPSSAPPSTSSSPPTTSEGGDPELPQLIAEFSPFRDEDLVSHTAAIPQNPEHPDAAASFFVDPVAGDDAATGTTANPVATIEAAQRLARPVLRQGQGDVVIYLAGGLHPRTAPLVVDYRDSGRDEFEMIYRSAPGEQAVIEGGVPVEGWQHAFGSVMVADVPSSVSDMRHFFASGVRQQRARSSKADGSAVEFLEGPLFSSQRNVAMTVQSGLVSGFAKPDDLELVYIGALISGHGLNRDNGNERLRPSWKAHRLPVTAATELGGELTRLDIGSGALYHASQRGFDPLELLPADPFFFENALELLDEPGEWYFDRDERRLYWWPANEEALAEAWVPVTEILLNVDGTPSRPVRNVRFEGIAFRHASYTLPNDEGYVVSQGASWFTGWRSADWMDVDGQRHSFLDRSRPPGMPGAAIQIDSARDVTFTGNVFTGLGAVGVMVHNDVRRATFDGNLFVDISAAALVAGHPVHDEIDEPMEGPVTELTFTNNIVDRAAVEFPASVGVQITKAAGADVSHNLFRDLPYSAISLGWGWNNNPSSTVHRAISVESNYFENVVNVLYDGAPVYLLGPVAEPGAARSEFVQIRGNFANNAGAEPQFKGPGDTVDPTFEKRPGVQLDEGSRNVLVNNNVFTGTTVWLQVTTWRAHRDEQGWLDALALIARRNWSDTTASEPSNLSILGADAASTFTSDDIPDEVLAIIGSAGLEPGVQIPPLP